MDDFQRKINKRMQILLSIFEEQTYLFGCLSVDLNKMFFYESLQTIK